MYIPHAQICGKFNTNSPHNVIHNIISQTMRKVHFETLQSLRLTNIVIAAAANKLVGSCRSFMLHWSPNLIFFNIVRPSVRPNHHEFVCVENFFERRTDLSLSQSLRPRPWPWPYKQLHVCPRPLSLVIKLHHCCLQQREREGERERLRWDGRVFNPKVTWRTETVLDYFQSEFKGILPTCSRKIQ